MGDNPASRGLELNDMEGIKEILWFLHRTIFELVPAFLANVAIYFLLGDLDIVKSLYWVSRVSEFFHRDGNALFQGFLIVGMVIFTSMSIKAVSGFLFWTSLKAKENLELYPAYVRFKSKIESDLQHEFGNDFKFDAREIQNFIRYKIMEEHPEFNTYLWYKSTDFYVVRDMVTSVILTSLIASPFIVLTTEFALWKYILLFSLSALPYCGLIWLGSKKAKCINKEEKKGYLAQVTQTDGAYVNTWSKLKLEFSDYVIGAIFVIGAFLTWLANVVQFPLLQLAGVNLLLLLPVYIAFIYLVLENKSFKKTLLDTYISMKYGKKLFSEE